MSSPKPTILYTSADISPQSGAFKNLLFMSEEIERRGFKSLLVLSEGQHKSVVSEGHNVRTMPLPQLKRGQPITYYLQYLVRNTQSIINLARTIRQEKITLVHINEILDVYAALAARIAHVPCVWHVRAELSFSPIVQALLSRIALRLAQKVIVVSQSVREHMFGNLQAQLDQIAIIHDPGPDLNQFHTAVDGSGIRREYGLPNDAYLVVLVAKLAERKGHTTLIRAAPLVLDQFPNTYFMCVGGELEAHHHKEYARKIQTLPSLLGVEKRTIFTSFRSDIPQVMAAADVVCHCSTYPDPFPGVVLQGMAVGKPVIASNLGGACEQVEHRVSGILIEPGKPEVLASSICELLGDAEERARIGEAAAKRARTSFTSETFFQRLSDLYSSLI